MTLLLVGQASAAALPAVLDAVASAPFASLTAQQLACPTPRPPVRLQTEALTDGRVRVTVTAGVGQLDLIQFGAMQNAQIEAPGFGRTFTSHSQLKLPAAVSSLTFFVVPSPLPQAGQTPLPATVPMQVVDGCGTSRNDTYTALVGETLNVAAGAGPPPGLLVNDQTPTNDAQIASFGGFNVGGDVTSHAAGSSVNLGDGGALIVNANGSFTFTPPSTAGATFLFRYRISSASGPAEASVTIEIRRRPTVTTVDPANGATNIALNSDITVTFSEAVNVTNASFTLECPDNMPFGGGFNVSGSGTTTATVNPVGNLPDSTACQLTVIAANVSDATNPSEQMAVDASFTFTTAAPPQVITTSPTNAATGIADTSNITINFSTAVHATTNSFTVNCSGAIPYTLSSSPATSFTLNPDADLNAAAPCTVTVIASEISDVNAVDPPDTMTANYVFTFSTVDSAPTVVSHTPANGATGVPATTILTINFRELIDVNSAADFNVECGGMPQGYTVTTPPTLPSSASVVVITPILLPDASLCVVSVLTSITDTDTLDPPNNLTFYQFTFTTEAPPSVVSSSPTNGATNVPVSSNITVTFDEPVNATAASFTLECPALSPFAGGFAVSGSGTTTVTINPSGNLPAGTICAVTVIAANVSDTDALDPPDQMPVDYTFTFTTGP